MDSNLDSSSTDKGDAKTAFCKPSKDTVNRNYRRRSPVSGSSSSDGSPERNDSSSPKFSRGDLGNVSEHQPRRKDDGREFNRDSERSYCGRSSDSYRHSARQSRNSNSYYRHADYIKHDKHAYDEERTYQKLSSRSGRESRGSAHFDHVRSRDYSRYVDKNSHDKNDGSGHRSKDKDRESKFLEYQKYKDDLSSERVGSGRSHGRFEDMERERDRHSVDRDFQDEKKDYRRSSRDFRSERNLSYEESRGHRSDSISRRDDSKHRESEGFKSDFKEMDDENFARDHRKKYDDTETKRSKDQIIEEPTEQSENKDIFRSEDQESAAKRPKLFNLDKGIAARKDVSKFTTTSDGRESSSSKQVQDGKMTLGKTQANHAEVSNDINAAKVAAMKAAELVNRNLTGAGPVGCMTADQKKKLLWGNKKNATAEEAGHRWDTALFTDRERQEKFNKLMSLRLPWCLWPIVGCERRIEVGAQPRQPRGHRSSRTRQAEGTPAGFREAVHGWTKKKRWPHCWFRSLSILRFFCTVKTSGYSVVLLCKSYACYPSVGLTWNILGMDLSFTFLIVFQPSEFLSSFACVCGLFYSLLSSNLAASHSIYFSCLESAGIYFTLFLSDIKLMQKYNSLDPSQNANMDSSSIFATVFSHMNNVCMFGKVLEWVDFVVQDVYGIGCENSTWVDWEGNYFRDLELGVDYVTQ